jgi:hypothetical protein
VDGFEHLPTIVAKMQNNRYICYTLEIRLA